MSRKKAILDVPITARALAPRGGGGGYSDIFIHIFFGGSKF